MKKSVLFGLLGAVVAGLNVPLSIFLLSLGAKPIFLAGITYLAMGASMGLVFLVLRLLKKDHEALLQGWDWLILGFINCLDTGANIMLFLGLAVLNGATASLLQSFEVVATALIAYVLFKERLSWRLILAILLVVGASVLLSFNPAENFAFEPASLLILGTTICWGFTNNLGKKLSQKDPWEFGMMKGLGAGTIIGIIAAIMGHWGLDYRVYLVGFLDGAIAYGLSNVLLVLCFRKLSASLGTALYAANPFIGALFALIFYFKEPTWNFYVALALLIVGEVFAAIDGIRQEKDAARFTADPS
jgi:drug/metabolite transporter (DMT)-like permease